MTDSTEVLELNVGGKIYFCSKATLTKDESSMFYKMFVTGDVSVPKDQRGRYFIDRKEKYFGKVYKFLRDGKLPSSLNALVSLQQEAQYYDLKEMNTTLAKLITEKKARKALKEAEEAKKRTATKEEPKTPKRPAVKFLENPTEDAFADALNEGWKLISDTAVGDKRIVTFSKNVRP